MGHEGCHVYDLTVSGGAISDYEMEFNAYMWNFNHRYGPFPYPFDLYNLFNGVRIPLELWTIDIPGDFGHLIKKDQDCGILCLTKG